MRIWRAPTQELKIIERNSDQNSLIGVNQAAPLIQLLNPIATGTDYYNRIGRKVRVKSLMFRASVTTGFQEPQGIRPIRIALVLDKQPNNSATPPVYSDMFQGVNEAGVAHSSAYSGVNLNNRDRFRVLKDWTFQLVAAEGIFPSSYTHGNKQILQHYMKLDEEQIFSDTPATQAAISTGAIYMVCFTDSAGAGNDCQITWATRVRFADA